MVPPELKAGFRSPAPSPLKSDAEGGLIAEDASSRSDKPFRRFSSKAGRLSRGGNKGLRARSRERAKQGKLIRE
jgi:hypothetical protein